jgi:hypothetical protein
MDTIHVVDLIVAEYVLEPIQHDFESMLQDFHLRHLDSLLGRETRSLRGRLSPFRWMDRTDCVRPTAYPCLLQGQSPMAVGFCVFCPFHLRFPIYEELEAWKKARARRIR